MNRPATQEPEDFQVIDGLKIHCRRHILGKAPTLLLANAWPMSLRCWDSTWEGLGRKFNLLAYDMPGFGHSESRPELMRPSAQGRFIVKLLDHFGLERVHGVAPNVATPAMLWLAAEQGGRLDSIVAFDGPGFMPSRLAWQLRYIVEHPFARRLAGGIGGTLAGMVMRRGYARHRLTPNARRDYAGFNGDRVKFGRTLDYFASYPHELPLVEKGLSAIRCPVLLLWGRQDRVFSPRYAPQLAQRITSCELRVMEGCGHFLQEDAGPAFVEQLLEWCGDADRKLRADSAVPRDTARFFAII